MNPYLRRPENGTGHYRCQQCTPHHVRSWIIRRFSSANEVNSDFAAKVPPRLRRGLFRKAVLAARWIDRATIGGSWIRGSRERPSHASRTSGRGRGEERWRSGCAPPPSRVETRVSAPITPLKTESRAGSRSARAAL